MEILLIAAVIGVIPAFIAQSKGRNFLLWYVYGVALFIIALIHSLLLKAPDRPPLVVRAAHSEAEELERFAKLKDQGLLTEEEFAAKKRQILGTKPDHIY